MPLKHIVKALDELARLPPRQLVGADDAVLGLVEAAAYALGTDWLRTTIGAVLLEWLEELCSAQPPQPPQQPSSSTSSS